jgi:hypothetical protein
LGLFFLYLLLKSKSSSTVIIDGSTGSSSQGSLNAVMDSVAFGSSLIAPISKLFSGTSSPASPYVSTGGVLVGGGSSYGPTAVSTTGGGILDEGSAWGSSGVGISSTGLVDPGSDTAFESDF